MVEFAEPDTATYHRYRVKDAFKLGLVAGVIVGFLVGVTGMVALKLIGF